MVGDFSLNEREILGVVNVGASALSMLGSTFTVLCYLLFKDLRKFSYKIIFYLALSDMLCNFFNILGDPGKGFFFFAQSYSTHFCVASFLWTTTIAFTLHRTVVKHKIDVEELGAIFHLFVWGTSLVMIIIPSIGDGYAPVGVWCWVKTTSRSMKVLHFLTFYAPLWGAIMFNEITYSQVFCMINNATQMAACMYERENQTDSRADMKTLNQWGYYPLILIGSWIFATLNRIHDFIEPHKKIFWIYFLDVGTAALMGLFNSIAYGLNASVCRTLRENLDLWCPERCRKCLPSWVFPRGQE